MKKILLMVILVMGATTSLSALSWEERCDKGELKICNMAGYTYKYDGEYEKALKVFKKGCDGNFAQSCSYLGTFYREGLGVKQNTKKSKMYYKKACEIDKGTTSDACFNLGLISNHEGNYELSLKYYDIACYAKGEFIQASACANLGNFYLNRSDAPSRYQAKKAFKRACDGRNKYGCEKYSEINK